MSILVRYLATALPALAVPAAAFAAGDAIHTIAGGNNGDD